MKNIVVVDIDGIAQINKHIYEFLLYTIIDGLENVLTDVFFEDDNDELSKFRAIKMAISYMDYFGERMMVSDFEITYDEANTISCALDENTKIGVSVKFLLLGNLIEKRIIVGQGERADNWRESLKAGVHWRTP